MICKGEILKQCDDIKMSYQRGAFRIFDHFDTLLSNMDKMLEYFETNDLWENIVYGANESLPYICLYILVISCVVYKANEELTDCNKFYAFVDNWFRDNYEKQLNKEVLNMMQECAKELSDVLNS